MKALHVFVISALLGGMIGAGIAYSRSGPVAKIDLLAGPAAGPVRDPSVAAAVVEEPEYDFGVMQRGSKRRHEFIVRNEGGGLLRIAAGDTSCKCTNFDVANDSIPPGGQSTVALEWVAKSLPGPFRQTAFLRTNDPLKPRIQLMVDGQVIEPAGMEPHNFTFGEIRTGEVASASVLYYSNDAEDLKVEATAPQGESVDGRFEVTVTPAEKEDLPSPNALKGYRITLTTKPGLPVGQVMEWVTLKTNQPDSEEIEVPVYGRVRGDISAHGSGWNDEAGVLHLGMVSQATGAKRRLLLSVKGEHAANTQFEVVSVDPSELKAEIGETVRKSNDIYHTILTVKVPPGTRPMVHLNNAQGDDGLIRLKTTHPKSSEMTLRVRFAVVQ